MRALSPVAASRSRDQAEGRRIPERHERDGNQSPFIVARDHDVEVAAPAVICGGHRQGRWNGDGITIAAS